MLHNVISINSSSGVESQHCTFIASSVSLCARIRYSSAWCLVSFQI